LKLILSLFLQLYALTFVHVDFAEPALPLSASYTGRTTSRRAGWLSKCKTSRLVAANFSRRVWKLLQNLLCNLFS